MESEADSSASAPEVDVERSDFTWMIFNFNDWFQQLNANSPTPTSSQLQDESEDEDDFSEVELLSEEFTRGQHVGRTSRWQLEIARIGDGLALTLRCTHCYHDEVNVIWIRCRFEIVDVDGTVLLSHKLIDDDSPWEYNPPTKPETSGSSDSFWTRVISMSELSAKWKEYVPRNILILRVKMYVFNGDEEPKDKPDVDMDPPAITDLPDGIVGLSAGSEAFVNAERSNQFLKAVGKLWDTMEASDLTIKIYGGTMRAHKFVVAVQSPVLKEMIREAETASESENGTTVITVPRCHFPVFKIILKYLYVQEAGEIEASSNIDLIKAVLDSSSQFKVEPLAQICITRFMKLMTLDSFPKLAFSVFNNVSHEDPLLKRELQKFLVKNQGALQESEKFKMEAKAHPDSFCQLCLYSPSY